MEDSKFSLINPVSNLISHTPNILNITNDTNKPKGNQQWKRRGGNESWVGSKPGKPARFHSESEQRNGSGRGKQIRYGDSSADNAHDKSDH